MPPCAFRFLMALFPSLCLGSRLCSRIPLCHESREVLVVGLTGWRIAWPWWLDAPSEESLIRTPRYSHLLVDFAPPPVSHLTCMPGWLERGHCPKVADAIRVISFPWLLNSTVSSPNLLLNERCGLSLVVVSATYISLNSLCSLCFKLLTWLYRSTNAEVFCQPLVVLKHISSPYIFFRKIVVCEYVNICDFSLFLQVN